MVSTFRLEWKWDPRYYTRKIPILLGSKKMPLLRKGSLIFWRPHQQNVGNYRICFSSRSDKWEYLNWSSTEELIDIYVCERGVRIEQFFSFPMHFSPFPSLGNRKMQPKKISGRLDDKPTTKWWLKLSRKLYRLLRLHNKEKKVSIQAKMKFNVLKVRKECQRSFWRFASQVFSEEDSPVVSSRSQLSLFYWSIQQLSQNIH